MVYIIDGYNVMHAAAEGGGIEAAELEEKRRDFIEGVISQTAVTGEEALIVFDSTAARTPDSQHISGTNVTVHFASAAESADIIIGKLVQQYLAAGEDRIRVVSADWEVQKGSMQARVERIPPRHFLSEKKNLEKMLEKSSEKGRIRWKLEHKLDVETLKKLEEMRRRRD